MQKVRSQETSSLLLFVGVRFQVCFTPLVGVLFTFPSRYWFTIGRQGVLRLGGWSTHVQTGFHVSRPILTADRLCDYGAVTRSGPVSQPVRLCQSARPGPRSLATTSGVSVDVLSSGY